MSKHLQRDLDNLQRDLMTLAGSVEEQLQKAIRSMEVKRFGLGLDSNDQWLSAIKAVAGLSKQSWAAATFTPVLGLACSLISWLVTAKKEGGVLTVATTEIQDRLAAYIADQVISVFQGKTGLGERRLVACNLYRIDA